jgi:hypothetical protein
MMNDRFLRTGVFLAPFHALNENPTLAIERDMDLLVHLDKLNYHEAWVGEHHSGGFEIIACPEMFIAAAAERWDPRFSGSSGSGATAGSFGCSSCARWPSIGPAPR